MKYLLIYYILLKSFLSQEDKKMYFFDRPKVNTNPNNSITLYTSIKDYYLLSYKPITFNFDFTSSKILINKKNFDCLEKNYCYIENEKKEKRDQKKKKKIILKK